MMPQHAQACCYMYCWVSKYTCARESKARTRRVLESGHLLLLVSMFTPASSKKRHNEECERGEMSHSRSPVIATLK